MKLYIVRHGETNENKETKLMGRNPGKLSNKGKQQSEKTGVALIDEKIDLIYTSPLARCLDTVEIINKSLDVKITKDDLLLEREFGKLTNTTLNKVDFNALDTPSEENDKLGVESLSSIMEREKLFIRQIKKKHFNNRILVVCHNNPIRMILAILLNTTYYEILDKFKIHNCGITIFNIEQNNEPNLIEIDNTEHLNIN